MSKETICLDEIILTSKKDTIFHAFEGDIVFVAGNKNIWAGKQGNEIGNYIPMKFIPDNAYIPIVEIDETINNFYKVKENKTKTWILDSKIQENLRKPKLKKIEFLSEDKIVKIKFNIKKGNSSANDNDGGDITAKFFDVNGILIEKQIYKKLNYGDTFQVEWDKSKKIGQIDFYANDNDIFGTDGGISNVFCGVIRFEAAKCYCLEMGLVNISCNGKGIEIKKEHYKKLAKELDVEEAAIYAVSKQESMGGGFMQYKEQKCAKILYERHYVFRLLKNKKGLTEANNQKNINEYIVNQQGGKYSYNSKGQKMDINLASRDKLEIAKQIDYDIAIKSCSWGTYQVMGEYYHYDYNNPQDFEKAMNMCELQHISYFKTFLLKEKKGAHKALKLKNWEQFTYYYNGAGWKKNNSHYPTNMKKYYEEYH